MGRFARRIREWLYRPLPAAVCAAALVAALLVWHPLRAPPDPPFLEYGEAGGRAGAVVGPVVARILAIEADGDARASLVSRLRAAYAFDRLAVLDSLLTRLAALDAESAAPVHAARAVEDILQLDIPPPMSAAVAEAARYSRLYSGIGGEIPPSLQPSLGTNAGDVRSRAQRLVRPYRAGCMAAGRDHRARLSDIASRYQPRLAAASQSPRDGACIMHQLLGELLPLGKSADVLPEVVGRPGERRGNEIVYSFGVGRSAYSYRFVLEDERIASVILTPGVHEAAADSGAAAEARP